MCSFNSSMGIKHVQISCGVIFNFTFGTFIDVPQLGLRYSRWDSKQYCWKVPNYSGNLELIKDYFKERITELIIHDEIEKTIRNNSQRTINKNDLLVIKTTTGRLKVILDITKS